MRWSPLALVALLPACPGDVPVATIGDPTSSSSSLASTDDDPSVSSAPPPATFPTSTDPPVTTGDPDTTNSETAQLPDTETATSTSASTGPADTTTADTTTGPADVCGPPCDELWFIEGDLVLSAPFDTADLKCLGSVLGELRITGDADAAALAGLANLWFAGSVTIEFNDVLTDLAPLACLRSISFLTTFNTPALTSADLPALQTTQGVLFDGTALTAAPTFAPDITLGSVLFRNNPALVDLTGLAAYTGDDFTLVEIASNPQLTSLAGLSDFLLSAADGYTQVRLIDLPQLGALPDLEVATLGDLWLQDLPLLQDLDPLASLTSVERLSLFDMPGVKDLHGLHNLATASELIIGDCVNQQPNTPGMDALVDLTGLDALTLAGSLILTNNKNLESLAGAPLLSEVYSLTAITNPKLTQADLDALIAQLDQPPGQCLGDWNQCSCFNLMPW